MWNIAKALPQSVRFGLAGGLAAAVNWLVRFPLSALMPFLPAVLVATTIGMVVGFVAYRTFVFPGSSRRVGRQVRDFLVVNASTMLVVAAASMLIRALLLPFLRQALAEACSHALGIAVGAVLNYFGHSAVTFQDRCDHTRIADAGSWNAGVDGRLEQGPEHQNDHRPNG